MQSTARAAQGGEASQGHQSKRASGPRRSGASLPPRGPRQCPLSGRATSTERPLVSSALYPRARTKQESRGRERSGSPSARRDPAASTARTRRRPARARTHTRGLDPGYWGRRAGGGGACQRRGRAARAREGAGEGAGPRRPRRAGLSRPMSGVHMPRRRREGRQRRINAIRAASAEPSPTPPPVSSAAVSSAAVGGAELRGSGRRAAQLLSRRLPRCPPRRGLDRAPLVRRAGSPRRSAGACVACGRLAAEATHTRGGAGGSQPLGRALRGPAACGGFWGRGLG